MARTVHVPDLEPSAPTWRGRWGLLVSQAQAHPNQAWDLFPGSGAKVLARAGLSGFRRPALELGSQGIDSFLLEKRRGGSYYLTQPARRHRAMIENSENEAEGDHCTKVCLRSDFHIVCVCVSLAVRARIPNLQYGGACEPHTVSKGRMQFTFLCTCTGAATNKYQYLKIKWLEN